jgi:uncharacterized DUF497 family protein
MGMAANGLILIVAHTWRNGNDEHIRIISARKANRAERRAYAKGTPRA